MDVNLAAQAPFRIGAMEVDPARLEAAWSDGRAGVQPRAMQVLVVLAQSGGAVVSRDTLVEMCWGGRSVSDDAINRIIHLLRALADRVGPDSFAIQTIPKVGHRLVVASPKPGATAEPRLAVLAFDNLTGEPDLAYFSDGIAEEILHAVGKTTGLKVIGRSSSFSLRGPDKSSERAAAMLGATHILDGSVRRAGDRVRITARLEACATAAPLWSGRFDRPLSDVFAIQDEITAAVAATLNVAFTPSPDVGPIDPVAYDLYLRARRPQADWFVPDCRLLEDVVARAPRFGGAWALLALARAATLRWGSGGPAFVEQHAAIVAAAETALALDPGAGPAHLALAAVLPICGKFAEVRLRTAKALAVAPNDPMVLAYACGHHDIVGRQRAAFEYIARGYELDPRSLGWYYAYMLDATGRRGEAEQVYDRELVRWGPMSIVTANALRSAYEHGDWDRYDALLAATTPATMSHPVLALVRATGDRLRGWTDAEAAASIEEVRRNIRETGTTGLTLPAILCSRGHADDVYQLLEEASFVHLHAPHGSLAPGDFGLNVLFTPLSRTMREDRRFVRLCAKLGLCQFWAATDEWPDCLEEVAPYYDLKAETRRVLSEMAA